MSLRAALFPLCTLVWVLAARSPAASGPRVNVRDHPLEARARDSGFERALHPRLVRLREQARLHSKPIPYPPWDARIILDQVCTGETGGFCAQYASVLVQACLSMGYQGRYLDINAGSSLAWKLHEGGNQLEVQVRSRMGISGTISQARARL